MALSENLDVYFDETYGFATTHDINSSNVVCVVGDVVVGESAITGAFVDTMDITFKVADLTMPVKGQAMTVDSERWIVAIIDRDPSVFTVTLERADS